MGNDAHVPAQAPDKTATGANARSRDVGVPHATGNVAPVASPTEADTFTSRNTVQCQWDQCEKRAARRHPYWAKRWHHGHEMPRVAEYLCADHTKLAVLRDSEKAKRMTFGARRLGLDP